MMPPRAFELSAPGAVTLTLLDGFQLRVGKCVVGLPRTAQRLLAFLALHERPLHRLYVAGTLWNESTDDRANASLRTALWRLRRPGCALVEASSTELALAGDVVVDIRETSARARRVLYARAEDGDLDILCAAGDLLPDWYDDWLLIERERFRQLRLHALESLCEKLTAASEFARATEAGLAAVAAEPLRESAHRVLMKTYLAEGNRADAVREYVLYRELIADKLAADPSPRMQSLLRE